MNDTTKKSAHHNHGATAGADSRYLTVALALIVGFLIFEVIVAVISGSVALLSDAGHMLADAAAIAGSLFAIRLAARPTSVRWTFGLKRAEILRATVDISESVSLTSKTMTGRLPMISPRRLWRIAGFALRKGYATQPPTSSIPES